MDEQLLEQLTLTQREAWDYLSEQQEGYPSKMRVAEIAFMKEFVVGICAVGCGLDQGCFYCENNRAALKTFVAQIMRER